MRIALSIMSFLTVITAFAQTPTVTPMATNTPEPWVYMTLSGGEVARLDYVVSAGDIALSVLLIALFFSLWAMFLFQVFVKRDDR